MSTSPLDNTNPTFQNVVEADFTNSQNNAASQPRVQRTEYICQTIRNMMKTGQLKIGDKLPTEEKLCQHFNVSRTTLREAIQMLRFTGLLSVAPGRGSYVQQLSKTRLMDDFALYAQFNNTNPTQGTHLLALNLHAFMPKIVSAPLNDRRTLFDHLISRHDLPAQAAAQEAAWMIQMAKLSGNDLTAMLVEWMMQLQAQPRLARMENADELMQTIQCQIRLNSAIADGNAEDAQRQLLNFLKVSDVPDVTALAS